MVYLPTEKRDYMVFVFRVNEFKIHSNVSLKKVCENLFHPFYDSSNNRRIILSVGFIS